MADDRLLDLQRGVLGDRKISQHRRRNCRAACLTEQKRRMRIDVDEHLLDCDLGRTVLADHAAEITEDDVQPFGQLADGVAHAAARDVLELPSGRDDQAKTGHPQAGINAQDPTRVTCFSEG